MSVAPQILFPDIFSKPRMSEDHSILAQQEGAIVV